MTLPVRFEQAGILLGSIILVGLPVSALVSAVYGLATQPEVMGLVWILPGFAIGILLIKEKLSVTYHQVWVITLSSWLLAMIGWTALGLSIPAANTALAIIVWILAVLLGILIARLRPISTIRGYFRHA